MANITIEDVKTLLPQVPHMEHEVPDPETIRNLMVFLGINDRHELEEFVKAKEVFDFLADVYTRDLHRSPETPLDPTAVATWGVVLFNRGLSDGIKNAVIKKIHESDEYRQKHPYADGSPA